MYRLATFCLMTCLSTAVFAQDYLEIASHEDIFGPGSEMFTRSVATDGESTLYVFGGDNNPLGFEVIKYDTTTSTATKLTDLTDFSNDVPTFSPDDPFPGLGFGFIGATNELQLIDSASDAVYRINATTGVAYEFLSNAQIAAHTGQSSANIDNFSGTTVNGEAVFFDSASGSILVSSSAGNVSTLVTNAQLAAVTSDVGPESGITSDGSGNYFWGDNEADKIFKFDGSNITEVADITNIGGNSFSGDMFYAPDGLIYARIRTGSNALWSFDPDAVDPEATLTEILSGTELADGPLGSNFINEISWFEENVGFQRISSSLGYYAIPSPGTLAVAIPGLIMVLLRRYRQSAM